VDFPIDRIADEAFPENATQEGLLLLAANISAEGTVAMCAARP